MSRKAMLGITIAVLFVFAGTACGSDDTAETSSTTTEPGVITIGDPWCRTSPAATNSGACYLTIDNATGESTALVNASVPATVAGKVELHETAAATETDDTSMSGGMSTTDDTATDDTNMSDDTGDGMTDTTATGMMTMKPVSQIDLPAGETVVLEPGGYHVMLLDLVAPLQTGETIQLTLTFEDGTSQTVAAEVREV